MKKILIIEDELAYLTLLRDQLTLKGYTVVTAENGEAGLKMAKKERPDLILLDIRMPKMDGMAMLELLRKDERVKETKVIMLTNLTPDDKIIRGVVVNHPVYYFVKSDVQLNDLLEKIKEVLTDEFLKI